MDGQVQDDAHSRQYVTIGTHLVISCAAKSLIRLCPAFPFILSFCECQSWCILQIYLYVSALLMFEAMCEFTTALEASAATRKPCLSLD